MVWKIVLLLQEKKETKININGVAQHLELFHV